MDQDYFFELGNTRLQDVDPDEAPLSAEHYLKQVAADRLRQNDIVVAQIDTKRYRGKQTESYKHEDSLTSSAALAPPMTWQQKQLAEFSELRHDLVTLRAQRQKDGTLEAFTFPEIDNEGGWKSFCYRKFSKQIDREALMTKLSDPTCHRGTVLASAVENYEGTPPLLAVVLAMSQPTIQNLLELQITWFLEEEYSRQMMEWLFALLAVLEKPIEPETCSSLRDLARTCRQNRDKLQESDPMVREYSWFICVVGRYFDQKDLADNVS